MNPSKESVIKAAYKLFEEQGYSETTVKQISEFAEVAYGTVYFHFQAGKDDVLSEIARIVLFDFYKILELEYEINTKEELKETIYSQMMAAFDVIDKNKRIMKVFWEAKGKSDIVYRNFKELEDRFIKKISDDILTNRTKGIGKPVNHKLTSRALMHMVWGFIWDYILDSSDQPEEISDTVVSLYMYGIY